MSGREPLQPIPASMLLAQDVLFFVLLGATHGPAIYVATLLTSMAPFPAGWFIAPVTYVVVAVVNVIILARVLPSVPEGVHPSKSSAFIKWGLQLVVARLLRIQPAALLIRYSNVLRWIMLNGMGSRSAFSAQLSGDVNLLDYRPLTLGEGCMIGSEAMLSTHLVVRGQLICAGIEVGKGTLISARCMLGPGTRVGHGVVVNFGTEIGMRVRIGDGARIGFNCRIDNEATVGEGAVLEPQSYVPHGATIPAGQRWGGVPAAPVRESAPSS